MSLAKQSFKTVIIPSYLIALLVATPSSYLMGMNSIWNSAVSHPLQLLLFIIPFIMHQAFKIDDIENRLDQKLEKEKKRQQKEAQTSLLFNARYRPSSEQKDMTEWEIRNKGFKPWEKAIFVIEKSNGIHKEIEKHSLSLVLSKGTYIIQSRLKAEPGFQWRTMIITENGYRVDLAERWIEPSWLSQYRGKKENRKIVKTS
ncbi:MAG: hypothetical protein K0S74_1647 [Chlamydiales bacterium]|jgi:hypothetical protein|nr:hypothetical protein [Chlamydiales bacterium]